MVNSAKNPADRRTSKGGIDLSSHKARDSLSNRAFSRLWTITIVY